MEEERWRDWEHLYAQFRTIFKNSGMKVMDWSKASGLNHSHLYSARTAKSGLTVRTLNRMLRPFGYKLAIVPISRDRASD